MPVYTATCGVCKLKLVHYDGRWGHEGSAEALRINWHLPQPTDIKSVRPKQNRRRW